MIRKDEDRQRRAFGMDVDDLVRKDLERQALRADAERIVQKAVSEKFSWRWWIFLGFCFASGCYIGHIIVVHHFR